MSQIRSDILYGRKIKEAHDCEREIHRLHIATPIIPDEETTQSEPDNENESYTSSSDEIIEATHEENGEVTGQDEGKNFIIYSY